MLKRFKLSNLTSHIMHSVLTLNYYVLSERLLSFNTVSHINWTTFILQ